MHHYELETVGFWGRVTSTLDWCERNYHVNHYIAEFWNSITNVAFILAPLALLYNLHQQAFNVKLRHSLCYILMALVGVGSFAFHASLKYEMQMLDELPMIWSVCQCLYCLVRIDGRRGWNCVQGALILALATGISYIHLATKNAMFHQVGFGVLAVLCAVLFLFRARAIQPFPADSVNPILILLGSVAWSLAGFGLWNLDNIYCSYLRTARESYRWISPIFEFHAHWHLLTMYGSIWLLTGVLYIDVHSKHLACKGKRAIISLNQLWMPSVVVLNGKERHVAEVKTVKRG